MDRNQASRVLACMVKSLRMPSSLSTTTCFVSFSPAGIGAAAKPMVRGPSSGNTYGRHAVRSRLSATDGSAAATASHGRSLDKLCGNQAHRPSR